MVDVIMLCQVLESLQPISYGTALFLYRALQALLVSLVQLVLLETWDSPALM